MSGAIKQGIFTGQLFAPNADSSLLQRCNADLATGISVTPGISNWESVDCGEFKIKFCHLEGTQGRSSLSKDDYLRITRKLQTTCGICVYRDGVRVLPYGEPENDFLSIEERRSKKASRYIFSHRNIFGRIDINTENSLDDICQHSLDIRDGLLSDISPVLELLASIRNNNAVMETSDWIEAQRLIESVAQIKSEIDGLFTCSPDVVVEKSNEIIAKLNKCNSDLMIIVQRIHFNENVRLGALSKKGFAAKAAISENSEYSDEQIIGMLREDNLRLNAELDIYSDLANMGLAAEIVNHEFNQLFINVNNAIRNMAPYVKDPSAKYWLRQIDMGFRSISDRQNQLSPMYRSYSLKKAPVQLSTFIDEVCRFTESEIKRNQVDFVNGVSPSVVVKISKSKVFPALSNLINHYYKSCHTRLQS